uniref:Myosin IXB n=1 Tax=Leptobrachium leishanense TaxID=445787 RepID=A0A8C5QBR4_9ANUR
MSLKNDAGHEKVSHSLYVYPQLLSTQVSNCCTLLATKDSTASEVIGNVVATLGLDSAKPYVLAEVKESGGEEWVLDSNDSPVQRVLLWPRKARERHTQSEGYYFLLQEKNQDGSINYVHLNQVSAEKAARRLVERGFLPRPQEDYDDLCNLPKITEDAILANLKTRFLKHKIYTYAGSILIAINPFKFLPIYNPKYVKMYDNHQLGKLEPHIFAIADVSYHTMLKKRINQCIVISGESGSGKTQSTNFLIHCLTALSQKGYASGVERTILGAGPVLEAFGNAKTAHNNNSSRFGKFIQVNYLESGIVRGAVVEKYLLEKSRLVSQENNERNYHVFYYMLLGASEEERTEFQLKQPEDYFYLNQSNFKAEDGEDLRHDFERLKQAMEMVGFLPATRKQIFSVLSAILYLGNVTYKKKATGRDEGLDVGPPEVLDTLSQLLHVKREMLVEALTKRKTVTVNEKLILPYSLNEAVTARDSMAKSLYSALFDWIVLRINHALLNKKDVEEAVNCLSIGVLDIFGFEDFENNSFEQFCINYANEQLQYYFNQHIFKLEQEEYQSEGISWHNIDYTDNVGCIHLISKKPTGLFYLLDEESNFPHATYRTLLAKFKQQHDDNKFFVGTPVMEPAFIIQHFAGKVKYQIKDFREKNTDYMRPDIVALLRSSDSAYIRELIGMDPVSVFRWSVLRAAIRAMAVLNEAARQRAERTAGILCDRAPVERHSQLMSSIRGLTWQGDDPNLLDSQSLKIIMGMTLHDRTTKSLLHLHKKKKPPSISAQFQTSLNKLLETLSRAEPFFIRCIRSNAEKREITFDEALVIQQLRYTGMLETVRIRRSGYSAKYTYQEFSDQFQVLLPKSSSQLKADIAVLLESLSFDPHNFQLGKTKVFLKEPERQKLQDTLHQAVIKKIILLQSLFRMVVDQRNYLRMKTAAITIQAYWRSHCVRRALETSNNAAVCIQALWRGYSQRQRYRRQVKAIKHLQALCKGYLQRKREKRVLLEQARKAEEQARLEEEQARLEEEQARKAEEQARKAEEQARLEEESVDKDSHPPSVDIEVSSLLKAASQPKAPQIVSINDGGSSEKISNSREKRESRRLRGLQHDMLQNKHTNTSLEETDKDVDAQQPETVAQHQEGSKPEEIIEANDEKTDQEKEILKEVPSCAKVETQEKVQIPSPQKPSRPLNLPLDSQGPSLKQPTTPEDKRKQSGPRDPEIPSVGIIQRYSDHEKLKNRVEKWKEKRQPVSPDEGERLPKGSKPPPEPMDSEKIGKKNVLQKKKSNEPSTQIDAAPSQIVDSKLLLCLITACTASAGQVSKTPAVEFSGKLRRNHSIKISKATSVAEKWKASLCREITNASELKHLDDFLFTKINTLNANKTGVECLLCKATELFRMNLKSMYSSPSGQIHVGYKDLMENFQLLVSNLTQERKEKDVKLVLNLFQSFLDEFTRGYSKREEGEPLKPRKSHKKKRKPDQMVNQETNGHMFISYLASIGQSCEHCNNSIWPMEKAFLCSTCKMICHKKCLSKIQNPCSPAGQKKVCALAAGGHQFGVHVNDLTNDTCLVPVVMEILLEYLELHGLYTEGIYRKSGAANRMRELKQSLEKDPNSVELDNYPIHTITGILKQWLRELPEPLMTFAQYGEFLRAVELPGKQEQLCAIYKVIGQLPQANYNSLERLIFHLVKVALEENVNRMSPNSLAIVFAPCLLRCPDSYDPLTSMKDVSKTTTCVEMLIKEQMRQYKIKMQEIGLLEAAETHAVSRLSLLKQNTLWPIHLGFISPYDGILICTVHAFSLASFNKSVLHLFSKFCAFRDDLTYRLPELDQRGSDEENIDSETSNSTESLLDEKPAQSPIITNCPGIPDLSPLFAMSVQPSSFRRRPSSFLARMRVHKRTPVLPTSNLKLPPGILKTTDNPEEPSAVRRREQPGRRTDSVQSVYVPEGSERAMAQKSLDYVPSAKLVRRFSDPHFQIPSSEDSSL